MAHDFGSQCLTQVDFTVLSKDALGNLGERLVEALLGQLGWTILAANTRVGRLEIDIVAKDGAGCVHFVEVKSRRGGRFGEGREAITPVKLAHMRQAAAEWLMAESGYVRHIALDCAEVTFDSPAEVRIDYIGDIGDNDLRDGAF